MKKLLLLLFAIAPLYVSAQEQSFEAAIILINEKIKCCNQTINGITVASDGIMAISNDNGTTYDIDLAMPTYGDGFITVTKGKIIFYSEITPGNRCWEFSTHKDARQVGRALERLRSICLKVKK